MPGPHLAKFITTQRTTMLYLPTELLSSIFLLVRDATLRDAKRDMAKFKSEGYRASTKWIQVTHVCHRWRTIALGLPTLWSHIQIDLSNHEWAKEMLIRSMQAPLTVDVDLHGPRNLREATFTLLNTQVKENMERFKSLRLIRLTNEDLHAFLSPQLHVSQLESLEIAATKRFGSERPFILHDGLLKSLSLRKLKCIGVQVSLHGTLFSSVTHLKLVFRWQDPVGPPLASLLQALSQATVLRSLILQTAVSSSLDEGEMDGFRQNQIELAFLNDFQVYLGASIMADLLESIKIPSSCIVRLDFHPLNPTETFERIVGAIYTLLWPPLSLTRPCIQSLRIFDASLEGFRIHGFYEPLSHDYFRTAEDPHPPINIYFNWFSEGDDPYQELFTLLEILRLQDVVFLEINVFYLDEAFWFSTFGLLPRLRYIFRHNGSSGLLGALSASLYDPPLFPELDTLVIHDNNIGVKRIAKALRLRKNHFNLPIKRLSLCQTQHLGDAAEAYEILCALGCEVDFFEPDSIMWGSSTDSETDSDNGFNLPKDVMDVAYDFIDF